MTQGNAIHAVACLLLSMLFAGSAFAVPNGQQVQCDIRLGFGTGTRSYAPDSASVVPVTITINNDVANTKGTIEITRTMAGSHEVTETTAFSTPKNSRKRFTVLTRHQPNQPTRVSVRFDKHLADVSRLMPVITAKQPMVVCVGIAEGSDLRKRIRKPYQCVDTAVDLLPDDARAYEGLHSMAIRGIEFTQLKNAQLKAIRQWLVTGGRLLVMTPLDEQMFQRNAIALADKDADVFRTQGVHILGSGLVCSPGLNRMEENRFWKINIPAMVFFFELLEETDEDMTTFNSTSSSGLFKSLWSEQATSGQLGALWLILIVGAYVFVIGPLDFIVVKKLKKPGLTWAIFLTGIIGFSVIAYGYTNFINIGEMRTVVTQVIDIDPARKIARGNSMMWIYSAKNSTYNIQPSLDNTLLTAYERSQGVGSLAAVDITNGKRSQIETRIPIFSSKDFDGAWYMEWPHAITLSRIDKVLTVEVPEELKISSVCLMSEKQVRYLTEEKGVWTTVGSREKTISELVQEMNELTSYNHDSMPDVSDLQHYVQFLTSQDDTDEDEDTWLDGRALHQLSGKEKTLHRRSLLTSGHEVLLLFCKPNHSILKMTIKGGIPIRRELCALRIVLPKET